MHQVDQTTDSSARCSPRVLQILEDPFTGHGESVCFLLFCTSPCPSLRVSHVVATLIKTAPFRCTFCHWKEVFDSGNHAPVLIRPFSSFFNPALLDGPESKRLLTTICSGELAKVRRFIRRSHRCCRVDWIDTFGARCSWNLCPQAIPYFFFGWILLGCPCSLGQPKHYFVRIFSQIHTGKQRGEPSLCVFGIRPFCRFDVHVAAFGAVQERCHYSSNGWK